MGAGGEGGWSATMTTATAQHVHLPGEQLEWLFSTLRKTERTELGLSVLDLVRQDVVELEAIQEVFTDWAATAAIRHHLDFTQRVKNYLYMAETGELFADTNLSEDEKAAIQRIILAVE